MVNEEILPGDKVRIFVPASKHEVVAKSKNLKRLQTLSIEWCTRSVNSKFMEKLSQPGHNHTFLIPERKGDEGISSLLAFADELIDETTPYVNLFVFREDGDNFVLNYRTAHGPRA